MKKIIIGTLLTIICATAFAQEKNSSFVSKKGIYIFPEQGEFSLGFGTSTLFNYLGGFFSNAGGGTPFTQYGSNPLNQNAIYGKYMLSDQTALRVRLQAGFQHTTNIFVVNQSTANPDPNNPAFVEDEMIMKGRNVLVGFGIEKRRGKSRFQGVYGGEVLFSSINTNIEYSYGNDFSADFHQPEIFNAGNYDGLGRRIISDKTGSSLGIGARAFAGVEYFFSPKVSVGGEFGYSFMVNTRSNREITREYYNTQTLGVSEVTQKANSGAGGLRNFTTGVDNVNGSINLFIYF